MTSSFTQRNSPYFASLHVSTRLACDLASARFSTSFVLQAATTHFFTEFSPRAANHWFLFFTLGDFLSFSTDANFSLNSSVCLLLGQFFSCNSVFTDSPLHIHAEWLMEGVFSLWLGVHLPRSILWLQRGLSPRWTVDLFTGIGIGFLVSSRINLLHTLQLLRQIYGGFPHAAIFHELIGTNWSGQRLQHKSADLPPSSHSATAAGVSLAPTISLIDWAYLHEFASDLRI